AWERCKQGWSGPPITDEANGKLADSIVLSSTRLRVAGDALTAHLEATRRLGGLYGYLFRTPLRRAYYGPGIGNPVARATLWLYTYRPGPSARAANAVARRAR